MSRPQRIHIKIARRVLEQIDRIANRRVAACENQTLDLLRNVQDLTKAAQNLALCRSKGWIGAAGEVEHAIPRLIRDLSHGLKDIERLIETRPALSVSLRDVVEDLGALEDEFDEMEFKKGILSVTTEPITLEDVDLGPFKIMLNITEFADLRRHWPFSIEALEPNPAAGQSDVTHPHVSGGKLCTGDAGESIMAALETGRIMDFFHIINGILTTYNSRSPYVPLERWTGVLCFDCGYVMDDSEESFYCEGCEHDFCQECFSYCHCCNLSRCRGCLTRCPFCHEYCCVGCLGSCEECGRDVCRKCIKDGYCPDCYQEKEYEDDESDDGESAEGEAEANNDTDSALVSDDGERATPGSGESECGGDVGKEAGKMPDCRCKETPNPAA
jgi:hypothetical protein